MNDSLKRAIREHRRDFLAIVGLLVIALAVSSYILTNQRLTLPAWVPVIGKDFYEFNGDFQTSQAVTPGQGQTVNVAGVNVGEIARVELVYGRARLRLRLDDDDVVVRRDARMLLRPKTGLKDMVVELDPGSDDAPALPEGGTIPISRTSPDVNLDELLAALDANPSYLPARIQLGVTLWRAGRVAAAREQWGYVLVRDLGNRTCHVYLKMTENECET